MLRILCGLLIVISGQSLWAQIEPTGTNSLKNTYGPNFQELIIRRTGYDTDNFDKAGKCPKCRQKVYMVN